MQEVYGLTDIGCVRKNNEDCFLIDQKLGLYVVADGMGGAQAGERASRLAVDTVAQCIAESPIGTMDDLLHSFEEANRRVLEVASSDADLDGMGTTMVAMLERNGKLAVANVGDSRAYLFQDSRLQALTEDQNWACEVGKRLGLDDEVLRTHPLRHVLTMAIGVARALRVGTCWAECAPGAQFLLCSDGLYSVVGSQMIAATLSTEQSLEDKSHQLIEAARKAGGPDNITAVLLRA